MTDVSTALLRETWEHMVRARALDQAMARNHRQWHESRGEEATYIGAYAGLEVDDVIAPHFRGICGVALSTGADPVELVKSVLGSPEGTTGGQWRGDIGPVPSRRFFPLYSGTLGPSVAYAAGAALRSKLAESRNVAVTAFGDGTSNTGIVNETFNLATMLSLPIIFVAQDNGYATSLASSVSTGGSMVARAAGFGMQSVEVDGNDAAAVLTAQETAVARARDGGGPTLIHARTYRMGGHYMNDPELYRTEEERELWATRDPIIRTTEQLIAASALTDEDAQRIVAEADREMEDIVVAVKDDMPAHTSLNPTAFAGVSEGGK